MIMWCCQEGMFTGEGDGRGTGGGIIICFLQPASTVTSAPPPPPPRAQLHLHASQFKDAWMIELNRKNIELSWMWKFSFHYSIASSIQFNSFIFSNIKYIKIVHNNITYKVEISNYTACNVNTIKTLKGGSQKGKLGSLYLGRPV